MSPRLLEHLWTGGPAQNKIPLPQRGEGLGVGGNRRQSAQSQRTNMRSRCLFTEDCNSRPFKTALALALISAVLASCGVKNDLERPQAQMMMLPENRKDPSRPPVTLGQTGTATTPPYTTGP